ncbi:hypothetical protein DICVIV_14052 [Dictyocaulus viviparus]|uniref:Uncharacterized protein n=1 Tax=Dictyocaulus viviparus TaxID=29172 RepID=A0A0D8X667_DICVI|nr:hypothetical protein DICVIV_14052 [Dictyocaulus viviparus]
MIIRCSPFLPRTMGAITVPTADLGFFEIDFWLIDIAGESPVIDSTSAIETERKTIGKIPLAFLPKYLNSILDPSVSSLGDIIGVGMTEGGSGLLIIRSPASNIS